VPVKEDPILIREGVPTVKVPRLNLSRITRLAGFSLVLAVVLTATGAAFGQTTDGVRVIDIKYIFDHHPGFRSAMEGLKKDFDASAQRVQQERNAIMNLEKQLKDLNPGSDNYRQLDETLARRKADWKIEGDRQLKEFRNRESQILWNVYYQIQTEVEKYCKTNNVGLVLQFNGDPVDYTKPPEVVKGIGRNIVWVAPNRDITPHVLQAIVKNPVVPAVSDDRSRPQPGVPPQPNGLRQ